MLVLLPLWASYLARVYSWRLILNSDGLLNWWLGKLGLRVAEVGKAFRMKVMSWSQNITP